MGVADLGEVVAASTEVEDVVHDSRAKPTAWDGQGGHLCPLVCERVVALERRKGEREGGGGRKSGWEGGREGRWEGGREVVGYNCVY